MKLIIGKSVSVDSDKNRKQDQYPDDKAYACGETVKKQFLCGRICLSAKNLTAKMRSR